MSISPTTPHRLHPPFVTAMIIPTGTGASIGGYAGDATPFMNLLASVSDVLITHPNVANAAVFQQLPLNALYVEGYALDQFMAGNWGLQPVRKNRIGVVFDSAISDEMLTLHLNTINAAKTVYGLDIVGYVKTDAPVETLCEMMPSGCSSGTLKNPAVVLAACIQLLRQGATAIALCTQLPELPKQAHPEKSDSDNAKQSSAKADDGVTECEIHVADSPEKPLVDSIPTDTSPDLSVQPISEFSAEKSPNDDKQAQEDTLSKKSSTEPPFLTANLKVFENAFPASLDESLLQFGDSDEDDDEDDDSDDLEEGEELDLGELGEEDEATVAEVIQSLLGDNLLNLSKGSLMNWGNTASSDGGDDLNQAMDFLSRKDGDDLESNYRQGKGVDPIGGLEGILSHLVVSELGVPCAHAPVFPWEEAKPVLDEVLDPRAAAEFIAPTFLPCVLTGLMRAPHIVPAHKGRGTEISIDDVSVLVAPANALGSIPVFSALERGIPIILVGENTTVLDIGLDAFELAPPERRRLLQTVHSYEEAAGRIQMMRLGLTSPSGPVEEITPNKPVL